MKGNITRRCTGRGERACHAGDHYVRGMIIKLPPQAISNTVLMFLAIVVSLGLSPSCVSQLNKQAFRESAPRRVGLVIGHDIKAVSSMTNQEEAWVAISFGLIGVAVLDATAKQWTLDFAEQINKMVQE
jgi:hypothetical protein